MPRQLRMHLEVRRGVFWERRAALLGMLAPACAHMWFWVTVVLFFGVH